VSEVKRSYFTTRHNTWSVPTEALLHYLSTSKPSELCHLRFPRRKKYRKKRAKKITESNVNTQRIIGTANERVKNNQTPTQHTVRVQKTRKKTNEKGIISRTEVTYNYPRILVNKSQSFCKTKKKPKRDASTSRLFPSAKRIFLCVTYQKGA